MSKSSLLALLLALTPAASAANDRAGGELGNEPPDVDGPSESFDKWLGSANDGRDLAELVKHLHGRIRGEDGVPGLDRALGAADRRYAAQGGADAVQKALLFNGKQARDGLREAYDELKEYAEKLGLAWGLQREADARLMAVLAKQADAAKRVKAAAVEARVIADGIVSAPPSSEGGDPDAGTLGSLEPQERELAETAKMVELAKEALADLEGRLKGLEGVKQRVKRHAERAGLLDQGSGAALSASLTGKGGKAEAGTSKEIIADALSTLEKAMKLGEKSRQLMGAVVEKVARGAEKAAEAEKSILEAKGEAEAALAKAYAAHREVSDKVRPEWQAAEDEAAKAVLEARAAELKTAAAEPAAKAATRAKEASAEAAAAKAACTTCNCAKGKATKALGDTGELSALKKLSELDLATAVQDGEARGGAGQKRLNLQSMRSVMRGGSFDGRPAR